MGDQNHLLTNWLFAFLHEHDAAKLAPSNSNGILGVAYGSLDIVIEIDQDDLVHFHVGLVPAPIIDQLSFFQELLHLNLLCISTGGATLALDPNDQQVVLCRRFALNDLNEKRFVSELTAFIRYADHIKTLLVPDKFWLSTIDFSMHP
jgi:hypothetical protein